MSKMMRFHLIVASNYENKKNARNDMKKKNKNKKYVLKKRQLICICAVKERKAIKN